MWICPNCGREFKRNNQAHYCGNPPVTVDEYIEQQEPIARGNLQTIRDIIRNNTARVVERIAWSMPIYERNEKSLSFAAGKKQVSLYIGVEAIDNFQTELKDFVTKKSAVYLPYDKALPQEQLVEIVKWCFN